MIHHIELWVPNMTRAEASGGWLLVELGYEPFIQWPEGQSWRAGSLYIVLVQSPDRTMTDSRRSREDRPACTVNSPAGQDHRPASSSDTAKIRAGTRSVTSAASPGAALAPR